VDPTLRRLFEQEERQAQRIASLVRLGTLAVLWALLEFGRPPELRLEAVEQGGLLLYGGVTLVSLALARSSLFRPWQGPLLAVVDVACLMAVTVVGAYGLGVPLAQIGALPPVQLAYLLLALAAMRYTPAAALMVAATAALGLAALALGSGRGWFPEAPPGAPPAVVFGPFANTMRALLFLMTAGVVALAVLRGRRVLLRAIAEAHHAANLSRTLPPQVARLVGERGAAVLEEGRHIQAAVLFADIRGFTTLSEGMDPAALGRLLSAYRSRQRRVIEGHGGAVDKFIGDAVLAVFGIPDGRPEAAAAAVAAARDLLAMTEAWNAERPGEPPLRLGIGVHWGGLFAGAVGDDERLEFTVLGDAVNVTQRLEQLTKTAGAPLIASAAALEAGGIAPDPQCGWRPLPSQPLRGRGEALALYAFGAAEGPAP